MKFRRWAFAGAFAFAAVIGGSAHAETSSDTQPVGFPEPVFNEGPTPECAAAEAAIQGKLQLTRGTAVNLPMGDVLAALVKARTLCRDGHPDRGMMVYIRISDALANALALAGRRTR